MNKQTPYFLLIITGLLAAATLYGQKPALDTSVFRAWPKLGFSAISANGQFIAYEINTLGFGRVTPGKLILQPRDSRWQMEFPGYPGPFTFSADSRTAIISLPGDSLALVATSTQKVSYIARVASYRISLNKLLYTTKDSSSQLHVHDLADQVDLIIDDVRHYEIIREGKELLLHRYFAERDSNVLSILDLQAKQQRICWSGGNISQVNISPSKQIFALLEKRPDRLQLWIYDLRERQAKLLWQEALVQGSAQAGIGVTGFSTNEKKVFVRFTSAGDTPTPIESETTGFSVWRYNDANLPTERLPKKPAVTTVYAIDRASGNRVFICGEQEEMKGRSADFALVSQRSGTGSREETAWNPYSQQRTILVSLADGKRIPLPMEEVSFSLGGRFLFYYDYQSNDYYTRELSTSKTVNITARLKAQIRTPSPFYQEEFTPRHNYLYHWMDDDSAVILYGQRDIWLVDPTGTKPAVNLTNGYGARHNIAFYPVMPLPGSRKGKKLILAAFNFSTKENGFYYIRWGRQADPEKCCMDKRVYYMPLTGIDNNFDNQPVKAANTNTWLIKAMSETESPNLFTTSDFKTFERVSHLFPEKKYNWLQTELLRWRTGKGDWLEGILYKPEDFDAAKQYPVIFHYYEEFTDNLHGFRDPGASIGPMNVPWYVSHGYLVFIPDIHYRDGETGENALEAVTTAVDQLVRLPYVDSTKMGIHGHSFGGYETNFILTHTQRFAAACTSSGVSDLVSFAGSISGFGTSMHFMASEGQIRLGKKLWEDPQRYIRNSPIFFLDRVTTPLFMMHTTEDKAVPVGQALEFFNGLRQAQKKAWMVLYTHEDHVLNRDANILDYTNKQFTFFNHFLKNEPAPAWMHPGNKLPKLHTQHIEKNKGNGDHSP